MNAHFDLKHLSKDRIFVSSDFHFNHNKEFVWGARGYLDVTSMTTSMISKINEVVKEDDMLIHLGDFCLNTTDEQFQEIVNNILCKNIYLLWGNHNNPVWKFYIQCVVKTDRSLVRRMKRH